MDRAQKGEAKSDDRQSERRIDEQNPGSNGCPRQPCGLSTAAWHHHHSVGVTPLIEDVEFDVFRGDKAFDAHEIVEEVNKRGAKAVISQIPAQRKPLESDQEMYKWRHLIENFFCKLKEFKRIAMRSDKNDDSCSVMIYDCCINYKWTMNLNKL